MRDGVPARLVRACGSPWAQYALLAPLLAFAWWGWTRELDLSYAAYGMGPMSYVYKACDPASFARDFPGGTEQSGNSAAMYPYLLAYRLAGVTPERLLPVYVAFELALMAGAMIALTRTLRPNAPPIVSVLVVALVVASGARDMNLAFFRQPLFWGLYYNIADGLRLLAIVMMLRGRALTAAVLAAGSVMSHAAMGLAGAVFLLALAAAKPRDALKGRTMAAAALFVALGAGWVFGVLGVQGVSGGQFPSKLWFDLTRLTNFHWYPENSGVFTFRHELRFVPFLSFLLLLSFYLTRAAPVREADRKVACGMGAMLLLVVMGVAFAGLRVSPTLVKLGLHRSNELVLTVGLVYVVAGLWDEVRSGQPVRQMVAAAVLVSPFLGPPGFPLLGSALLSARAWRSARGGAGRLGNAAVAACFGACLLAIAFYVATGRTAPLTSAAYTGLAWLTRPLVLAGIGVFVLAVLARRWAGAALAPGLALAAAAASVGIWVLDSQLEASEAAWARDYKDVQVWARQHTPKDALFMVNPADPTAIYGWRDYAQRSSFGNLREWLLTSWSYSSDFAVCQEGLRRVGEFGVKVDAYLGYRPMLAGYRRLEDDVLRRYCAASDAWRLDLARRYGIAFFVLEKAKGGVSTALPVAYENARFVVLAVRPQGARRRAPLDCFEAAGPF